MEGGGGVLSASGPIQKAGGGGGGGGCLKEEGEVLYMKEGFATPNPPPPPPPPPPPVSTPLQGIHEDDVEWYVTLVVYTLDSLKFGIMETVACEQQSNDQSVYTTDGITYTMPVLYGHNGAVDNTRTPKIYAFNTLEILYTQLSV